MLLACSLRGAPSADEPEAVQSIGRASDATTPACVARDDSSPGSETSSPASEAELADDVGRTPARAAPFFLVKPRLLRGGIVNDRDRVHDLHTRARAWIGVVTRSGRMIQQCHCITEALWASERRRRSRISGCVAPCVRRAMRAIRLCEPPDCAWLHMAARK